MTSCLTADIRTDYLQKSIRPAFCSDGEDTELIASIRKYGVLEPLLISKDKLLLHGYRRLYVAKYLKLATIPVEICTADLDIDVHKLTFLGHGPSLYAACVLREEAIQTLVNMEDTEEREQKWIKLELSTQFNRNVLLAGTNLIKAMRKMEDKSGTEKREYSRRVLSTFRNKGIHAALRLADQPPVSHVEVDPIYFEPE